MEYFPPNIAGTAVRPTIVFTDGYLNDPIQSQADPRVSPRSLLQHVSASISGGVSQYQRDQANFITVDLGSTTPLHTSVELISPIYKREIVDRVINKTFSQFTTE